MIHAAFTAFVESWFCSFAATVLALHHLPVLPQCPSFSRGFSRRFSVPLALAGVANLTSLPTAKGQAINWGLLPPKLGFWSACLALKVNSWSRQLLDTQYICIRSDPDFTCTEPEFWGYLGALMTQTCNPSLPCQPIEGQAEVQSGSKLGPNSTSHQRAFYLLIGRFTRCKESEKEGHCLALILPLLEKEYFPRDVHYVP